MCMFIKILITLFVILPQAHSFVANTKSSELKAHLTLNPSDSDALYNLALNEQKDGNPALSLALNERSRFINPFNLDAVKLTTISYDQLTEINNERLETVPVYFKALDFIPYFLLLALCLTSFVLFAWHMGKTVRTEAVTFKSQPKLRLKSSLFAALILILLSLTAIKSSSLNQTWACVIKNDTPLFTGPHSESYIKVGVLNAGTCSKVVLLNDSWVSLSLAKKTSGWTPRKQVLIVRANKFDPLFKSD